MLVWFGIWGRGGTNLNTNAVADLDIAGPGGGAKLVNDADALVATDLAGLGGVWEALPGVGHDAQVGVADAGVRAGGLLAGCSHSGDYGFMGTYRRTRTSPGPGVGVSSVSILVEIVPGAS